MITMSSFGHNGRLANQLFQYAAMLAISHKTKQPLSLPPWKYSVFFNGKYPDQPAASDCIKIEEPHFHYSEDWLPKSEGNYNLKGYFQSELYFSEEMFDDIKDYLVFREALSFKEDFIQKTFEKFQSQNPDYVHEKPGIAIHVRRGDYVNNPNYAQLPVTYYILALMTYFPDWQEHNLIFFSDDIEYCKHHFGCLTNAYFANGNEIEDLCLMSLFGKYILSNSSYSWWGAFIAGKASLVVRPAHHFAGKLLQQCDIKDFWQEDWIEFDHINEGRFKKIELPDVSITIPVQYDHEDRRQNLELCIAHFKKYFDVEIMVRENAETPKFKYVAKHVNYSQVNTGHFHRTKMLNDMCKLTIKPIVFNWDCDVLIPPMQIIMSVNAIRNGADVCYPYDGRFSRLPRTLYNNLLLTLDTGILAKLKFSGSDSKSSVGGALAVNKLSFFKAGMENENFISFGPEDAERWERFHKLDYKIVRIEGQLYHVNHFIGANSSSKHPHAGANLKEYEKVHNMNSEELRNYIKTWDWTILRHHLL